MLQPRHFSPRGFHMRGTACLPRRLETARSMEDCPVAWSRHDPIPCNLDLERNQ
jgi:hypothetical protein